MRGESHNEHAIQSIEQLCLNESSLNVVNKIIEDFKKTDIHEFEKSQQLFGYLINFVHRNKVDFSNDRNDLKVEFISGVLHSLQVDKVDLWVSFFNSVLNLGFKNIEMPQVSHLDVQNLIHTISRNPYLSKDFILGISDSRLNLTINDFLYAHTVVSFINILNMLKMS